jgi:DNA-binding XRE family transcriptional regulator
VNPETYKETRKSLGTQSEVAARLGVARETIARRETGKDRITREAALAIEALSKRPKNQRTPDTEGTQQLVLHRIVSHEAPTD